MNLQHALITTCIVLTGIHQTKAQNVGIGAENFTPDPSAALEVQSSNQGILIPRIDIEDLAVAAPVSNPAFGLLVFNINETTGIGFYYWNGTAWVPVGGGSAPEEPCTPSTDPTGISGYNKICSSGGSTTLGVQGGSLGTGAQWVWYTGWCGGAQAGTGEGLVVSPSTTTTYYVRAEGVCGVTNCVEITVTVMPVGAHYEGGKIAYVLQPGDPGYIAGQCQGLMTTLADYSVGPTSTWQWGCQGQSVGTTSSAIGTGQSNTSTIVNFHNNPSNFGGNSYYSCTSGCGSWGCNASNNGVVAAKLCDDLTLGDYADWFLPSKDELQKLYVYRSSIGGFTTGNYVSSTEGSSDNAALGAFGNGNFNLAWGKSYSDFRVRCVRYF